MTKWLAMALTIAAITTNEVSATPNDTYQTLDEAAVAALSYVDTLPSSMRYEYCGGIYQTKNGYKFTEPVTQEKRNESACRIAVPRGSARAIFHNHPPIRKAWKIGDNERELFSVADMESSVNTGLIMFISAGLEIYKWYPSQGVQKKPAAGEEVSRETQVALAAQ